MWCMWMMNHGQHGTHQGQSIAGAQAAGKACTHCGYPVEPAFAFCPNCGMSLRTTTCPSCRQAVDPTWKACPYCGTALAAGGPATAGHAHH